MSDDERPQLSAETLKVLESFLRERALQSENDEISENWQLSQFWYDDTTTYCLSKAALSLCGESASMALISCPTLYPRIKSLLEKSCKNVQLILFEHDERFSRYGSDYVYYDYNDPLKVRADLKNSFDVVIVDPPFLSNECLTKTVETINFIKKPGCKLILCTSDTMEELAEKLLNVKKCSFLPRHKNKLSNEFICLTNFGEISCE